MRINVKLSTTVQPAREIPQHFLWTSNIDHSHFQYEFHTQSVYIYTNPRSLPNFFDPKILKDALSQALVMFYPLAGRLRRDKSGRIEIDCNGAGVLFVEAECDGMLADFGDFAPNAIFKKLVPSVDYSQGISTYPLLVVQITHFKCGGVTLGVGMKHIIADGTSGVHFTNTWSQIARGTNNIIEPFMDRTILRARDRPQPTFHHIECQPQPPREVKNLETYSNIAVSIFKITHDQINSLRDKSKDDGNIKGYTSFEILAGHIWRCSCRARGLSNDQKTKLRISTDGRARLRPLLPPGYFGNVVIDASSIALACDLKSKSTLYAASLINEALKKIDNDYLRSTIDYWELLPSFEMFAWGAHMFNHADLQITSWANMPIHDADFGWGRPIFVGPCTLSYDGLSIILPSPIADGSLSVMIALQAEHLQLFATYLYEK